MDRGATGDSFARAFRVQWPAAPSPHGLTYDYTLDGTTFGPFEVPAFATTGERVARIAVPEDVLPVLYQSGVEVDRAQSPQDLNGAFCTSDDLQFIVGDCLDDWVNVRARVPNFQSAGTVIEEVTQTALVDVAFSDGVSEALEFVALVTPLLLGAGVLLEVPDGATHLHLRAVGQDPVTFRLDCGGAGGDGGSGDDSGDGGSGADSGDDGSADGSGDGDSAGGSDDSGDDGTDGTDDGTDGADDDTDDGTDGADDGLDGADDDTDDGTNGADDGTDGADDGTDGTDDGTGGGLAPGGGAGGGGSDEGEEPDLGSGEEPGGSAIPVIREAGVDRVGTAIEVAQSLFDDGTAGAVVLARSDIPADAVTATPFSVAEGAPILLTAPTELDWRVMEEIRRVLPAGRTVYLAGGEAALAAGMQTELEAAGYVVDRIWGANRFATAVEIADRLYGFDGFQASYSQSAGTVALVVDGGSFQEATVAGPAASRIGSAVLLSSGGDIAPETQAWFDRHPLMTAIAIGAGASTAMFQSASVVGEDDIRTAVDVAREFFPAPIALGVATNAAFADPLVGSVDIAHRGGPLLLSEPTQLPPAVGQLVADSRATLTLIRVYGGTAALSQGVVDALVHAANPPMAAAD